MMINEVKSDEKSGDDGEVPSAEGVPEGCGHECLAKAPSTLENGTARETARSREQLCRRSPCAGAWSGKPGVFQHLLAGERCCGRSASAKAMADRDGRTPGRGRRGGNTGKIKLCAKYARRFLKNEVVYTFQLLVGKSEISYPPSLGSFGGQAKGTGKNEIEQKETKWTKKADGNPPRRFRR